MDPSDIRSKHKLSPDGIGNSYTEKNEFLNANKYLQINSFVPIDHVRRKLEISQTNKINIAFIRAHVQPFTLER